MEGTTTDKLHEQLRVRITRRQGRFVRRRAKQLKVVPSEAVRRILNDAETLDKEKKETDGK